MSLKNRLKMSFLIIIVLPIILITSIGRVIVKYQVNSIRETYNVEFSTIQAITNPLQILNRVTRDAFNRIKLYSMTNPELLEDLDFINRMNEELKDKYSFLVVKKGDAFIYEGNHREFQEVRNNITLYCSYTTEVDGGIYIGGEHPVLVKQQNFVCKDGSLGTVYVLTDVDTIVPQVKAVAFQAIIAFVLIIVLTAVILIVWLYRGIIHPLNILKRATREMKEGNLDYSIHMNTYDEIGELCDDFEEMRIHLKELIEVKMQYEANTRELLSNISHDLKTPLTTIKGYAEGIIDGVADTPEKIDRYVKTIYHKANDMTALVDELSMNARIDNNSLPYNFRIIEVHDYFNDCIEELTFEMEVKNIKLTYESQVSENCKVIIDTEQMKKVIHNIINNSEKYMDKEEGRIKVSVKELKDFIQIKIEDNGAGIAEKDLPNIFERFYRADMSRNSEKGGSGLGLAIVRKIIEEHGGSIWATSNLGEGTTIYFTVMKWTEKAMKQKKFSKLKEELMLKVKA
ncbi:MAG: HAMP domain-containing sensor histidine kinase [Clostridiales bacterium]|nr:HAMP domain-containing sensor histidine kinase [Clostridiales bacterium]